MGIINELSLYIPSPYYWTHFWLNHIIYIYIHRCILCEWERERGRESKEKQNRKKGKTFAAFSTMHKMKNYEM